MLDVIEQLKLIRKLKQFQGEWYLKTPKQKWQVVHKFGAKVSELIGVRAYTDMKIGWYSYVAAVMIFVYVILVSYTMCVYFKQGDFLKGIECTYTVGIVSAVCFLLNWFQEQQDKNNRQMSYFISTALKFELKFGHWYFRYLPYTLKRLDHNDSKSIT